MHMGVRNDPSLGPVFSDSFSRGALIYSPVDFTDASDLHQSAQVWCIGEINRWIKQRTHVQNKTENSRS